MRAWNKEGGEQERERGATWGGTDLLDDALNVDRLRDILSLLDARHPARVAVSTCFNDARFSQAKGAAGTLGSRVTTDLK